MKGSSRLMLHIKEIRPYPADYELENGDILYESDWNGTYYYNKQTGETWTPIYRYQAEGINIEELDKNSREWLKAVEVIGFNKKCL